MEKARDLARACVEEFDAAIAAGKQLHRVAMRLLDPAKAVGRQFREFIISLFPLQHFPEAFFCLTKYSMVELVERRVESIHAIIKQFGAKVSCVTPPYICAIVREKSNMALLQSCEAFFEFCLGSWRKRDLMDSLLSQRFDAVTLRSMGSVDKTKAAYQCDLMSEFLAA